MNRREISDFDSFIRGSHLINLPLHSRSFTWYKGDGSCKSRLDRCLMNEAWLSNWPDIIQRGLNQSISDHCPLSLEVYDKDWGPKPFRSLDAWFSHPNFRNFVAERWNSYANSG